MPRLRQLLAACLLATPAAPCPAQEIDVDRLARQVTIHRDAYGVPHVGVADHIKVHSWSGCLRRQQWRSKDDYQAVANS